MLIREFRIPSFPGFDEREVALFVHHNKDDRRRTIRLIDEGGKTLFEFDVYTRASSTVGLSMRPSGSGNLLISANLIGAVYAKLWLPPVLKSLMHRLGETEFHYSPSDDYLSVRLFSPGSGMESSSIRHWSAFPVQWLAPWHEVAKTVLADEEIEIPMPEGTYKARAKIERITLRRWFQTVIRHYSTIDLAPYGRAPAFAGKGESGYDLDDDATISQSSCHDSIPDAVGYFVAGVLKQRARRGQASKPSYEFSPG